jgi:hypothetical protein
MSDNAETALSNLSLTLAKAMCAVALAMLVLVSPSISKTDGLKPKIEAMITMSWPPSGDNDIDIWIRDPDGKVMWYGKKEVDFLNLERDDMGSLNSTVMVDGSKVVIANREELVAIRGWKPGEYVVNVHWYRAADGHKPDLVVEPVLVTVKIDSLNPSVKRVWQGGITLTGVRQEAHVMRFSVAKDGSISDIVTDLPVMLRERIHQ